MSDSQREAYIATIEAENDDLRARLRDMERMYGFHNDVPMIFGLTASEAKVMSLLISRDQANKHQILAALMSDRGGDEEPEIKIVDVFICKIRVKLKIFDVPIETLWGRGYRMTPESKAKVAEYLQAEAAPALPVETFRTLEH